MHKKEKETNPNAEPMEAKVKTSKVRIYTPSRFAEKMAEIGASPSKKEVWGTIILFIIAVLIAGKFFRLHAWCFIPIVLCCVYVTPFMVFNSKKKKYELQRFNDANAYMSQFGQSFADTRSILTSLKETEEKYRDGKMKKTLREAINMIQESSNIRQAEKDALSYIESQYGCKKMRTLHNFILNAEKRGGDCKSELKLLERIRNEWVQAVNDGYNVLKSNVMLTYLEGFILLAICAVVQDRFPSDFAIAGMNIIQIVNTALICIFIFGFRRLDNRLTKSLLTDNKIMSEEEAEKAYEATAKLDIKGNLKKAAVYSLIFAVLFGVIFFLTKSVPVLVIGIIITLLVLNIYNISYFVFRGQIKKELELSFPEWVFDVILLLQKENVQVAIFKSIDNAPPVLRHELYGLKEKLVDAPSNIESYLTFLEKYEINGVENAMRILYSISKGNSSEDNMNAIAENNMQTLATVERQKIEVKNAYTAIYFYLPILPCVIALMVYGGALIFNVFRVVMRLIG